MSNVHLQMCVNARARRHTRALCQQLGHLITNVYVEDEAFDKKGDYRLHWLFVGLREQHTGTFAGKYTLPKQEGHNKRGKQVSCKLMFFFLFKKRKNRKPL